jgi:hypothetical protein
VIDRAGESLADMPAEVIVKDPQRVASNMFFQKSDKLWGLERKFPRKHSPVEFFGAG